MKDETGWGGESITKGTCSRNWQWCHLTGDQGCPSLLGRGHVVRMILPPYRTLMLLGCGLALGEGYGQEEVEEGSSWI